MLIGRRDREPSAGRHHRPTGLVPALLAAALVVTGLSGPSTPAAAGPAPVAAVAALPPALPSQPPPPEFVPPPECQAQHTQLLSVRQQIDAHNARPHTFRLPAQAAQAAAYDAEANQLNSAQQTAVSNLEICLQNAARNRAIAALADGGTGGPPVRTTAPEPVRRELEVVVQKIPSRWTPPPPPARGQRWEVDQNSPVRPVYELLRKGNPRSIGDVPLRGVPRPQAGDMDPAYPGSTYGRRPNGAPNVEADHIISLAELVQTPGFTLLTPDEMYAVANAPVNLQWLSRRANRAKSSRPAADIDGVDPRWRAGQVALEEEVRARLLQLITFLVYSHGEG
jgi:hypothetical protein